MAGYSGTVLTKQGKALQAKGQLGATIAFTKVKLGSGLLPTGGKLEDLLDLIEPIMTVSIQDVAVIGDGTTRVRVLITNESLVTGFFVREVGLYATDPDVGEILYAVSNAGDQADYLPAAGGAVVIEQVLDIITIIGNAQNVTAVIDNRLTLATKKDIQEHTHGGGDDGTNVPWDHIDGRPDFANYSMSPKFNDVIVKGPIIDVRAPFGLQEGAKGDGITDDAAAIQSCIDYAASIGGGRLFFPPGTYLIGDTLTWTADNIIFVGSDLALTILRDHPSLGAKRLINLKGTSVAWIKNFGIKDMTLRNGTASEDTYTGKKDCIKTECVDGVYIQRVRFKEVQGTFGFSAINSKNIFADNCIFYRWTYAAMTIKVGCDTVCVKECIFDTALAQNTPQNYTFATGAGVDDDGNQEIGAPVNNVWLLNNRFYNNQRWEGIDFHHGNNVIIMGNHVENCKVGLMMGAGSTDFLTELSGRNIVIKDNRFIRGNGLNTDGAGIILNGSGTTESTYVGWMENILIEGNTVDGFGGTVANTNTGAITLYLLKRCRVVNNEIKNYKQHGVCLYYNTQDVDIVRNWFGDLSGYTPDGADISSCVATRSTGHIGTTIADNISYASSPDKAPGVFLRASDNNASSYQLHRNQLNITRTGNLKSGAAIPIEWDVIPASQVIGKYGDIAYDKKGTPRWVVTSPKQGFGSLSATQTIILADAASGTQTITTSTDQTGATGNERWFRDGSAIVIVGAGAAGADLNATITKKYYTNGVWKYDISVPIETTVNGAIIKNQPLVYELMYNPPLVYGTAAPTTGSYTRPATVWNQTPAELGSAGSKYVILGWTCVAGGTPGTWVPMRVLTGN